MFSRDVMRRTGRSCLLCCVLLLAGFNLAALAAVDVGVGEPSQTGKWAAKPYMPHSDFPWVNDGGDAVSRSFSDDFSALAGRVRPLSTGHQISIVMPVLLSTSRIWTGGGVTDLWTDPDNWLNGVAPAPGDSLNFPEVAAQKSNTNDFAPGTHFNSIALNGNGYTLDGNAITLTSGISGNAPNSAPSRIDMDIDLDQAQAFDAVSSAIWIGGALRLNGYALTLNCSRSVSIFGQISGGGGITKNGTGFLLLTEDNSYSGVTQLNGGMVFLSHGNALGATGTGNHT
ncbi:MAG: hypothetical protein KAX84_00005, partial [Burkholderiales bacterium]|nr:hypothetical protein [Burkholderiales bacterium]